MKSIRPDIAVEGEVGYIGSSSAETRLRGCLGLLQGVSVVGVQV
jgi:hypothetical protein